MNTIVLGLGNPDLTDDSLGFRITDFLRPMFTWPGATIAQASVAGLDVLDLLSGYEKAIIIDAIQTPEGAPGRIFRLTPEEIAAAGKPIPHDINFVTALQLGNKLGVKLPGEIIIFAVEAGNAGDAETMGPAISDAIPVCAGLVIRELERMRTVEIL